MTLALRLIKRGKKMARFDFKNMTIESAEEECENVYGTPYGHNIISIICNQVKEKFGEDEANRLFEEYQV
tara:strand:- start:1922 stop:2131 length:210 start_codon:yes stop_codon:yes gene_type:complete